jgi:hypothetical protein
MGGALSGQAKVYASHEYEIIRRQKNFDEEASAREKLKIRKAQKCCPTCRIVVKSGVSEYVQTLCRIREYRVQRIRIGKDNQRRCHRTAERLPYFRLESYCFNVA